MIHHTAALITGATGGIGFAIAMKISSLVQTLVITGRESAKLKQAKEKLEASGNIKVLTFLIDLEVESDIYLLAENIRHHHLSILYLIHCAGLFHSGQLQNMTIDVFDSIYKINSRAPFLLSQALIPNLKSNNGQIVFINSSVVMNSFYGKGLYAFSKIVLKGIADVLRQELNPEGIKVISIFPGQTATQMQQKVHEGLNKTYHPELLIQPEDIAEAVYNTLTLTDSIEVTDVYMRPMKKPHEKVTVTQEL